MNYSKTRNIFFKYFDEAWWKNDDFSIWCYSGNILDVEKK